MVLQFKVLSQGETEDNNETPHHYTWWNRKPHNYQQQLTSVPPRSVTVDGSTILLNVGTFTNRLRVAASQNTLICTDTLLKVKSKGIPREAEVALRVPGRLRLRIFSTFGTTRVVGRQRKAPVAFTPGEIPGTHFQRLSRPQGTWFCWKEPRKKSQVTPPGIDPGTVRLVA